MTWIGILCVILGFCGFVTPLDQAHQLAIDPLSIFIDENLCRFCWKSFFDNSNHNESIKVSIKDKVEEWKVFEDNQFGKGTYCISKEDKVNTYKVPLTMTKSLSSPIIMRFTVNFKYPLGPAMEMIRYQNLPQGIHFELNSDFVGLETMSSPLCQVILISKSKGVQKFQSFVIKSGSESDSKISREIDVGSSFTVYYTCDMAMYFKTSSKFVVLNGVHYFDSKTSMLQPVIQAPFRRFIKVTLRHKSIRKRYDISISLKTSNTVYQCVKVFRIFIDLFQKPKKSTQSLENNCHGNVPVEDMVYSNYNHDGSFTMVLDMNGHLRIYKEYKMAIFWTLSDGIKLENYLHFTPLPNENMGYVNKNLLNIQWDKYNDILNSVPRMDQSVFSKNNNSPYTDINLASCSCTSVDMITNNDPINVPSTPYSKLLPGESAIDMFRKMNGYVSLYPYFYMMYRTLMTNADLIELVQIRIPRVKDFIIKHVQSKPNNEHLTISVNWEIPNYPSTIMPAIFAVIIADGNNDLCLGLYVLYCRTCNEYYLKETTTYAERHLKYWEKNCTKRRELHDHYDFIDSSISFTTDGLITNNIYKAQVLSFIDEKNYKSDWSKPSFLMQTIFMTYGRHIIGGICGLVAFAVLMFCFMCCRYLTRDPPVTKGVDEVSENDNMYDQDERL